MKGVDIAKELNIVPQTLCEWKKSSLFMAEVNRLKMDSLESTRASLQNSSIQAVSTLNELMATAKNEETRRKAAMDILRLTGFEPGQHESYAWGVGKTTQKEIELEKNDPMSVSEILNSLNML